jgi:hypothetical protein
VVSTVPETIRSRIIYVCRDAFWYHDVRAIFSSAGVPEALWARYAEPDASKAKIVRGVLNDLRGMGSRGPHNLTVSALDANGSESDVSSFMFEIGDSTPATEETADSGVQTTLDSSVTTTEPDGTSSTEVTSTAPPTPEQLPSGGGSIPSLSCALGNHRERYPAAILDTRYQCALHVVNFGIRLTPPPVGATRVSYVFESGFEWYSNGTRRTHTAWHDEPIDYVFHGTFKPAYNQAHVYGTDHLHYSYYQGDALVMVQTTVRLEFIAVP